MLTVANLKRIILEDNVVADPEELSQSFYLEMQEKPFAPAPPINAN